MNLGINRKSEIGRLVGRTSGSGRHIPDAGREGIISGDFDPYPSRWAKCARASVPGSPGDL
jgi:hypothetical protein